MRNELCAGNTARPFPADTQLPELTVFVLFTGDDQRPDINVHFGALGGLKSDTDQPSC